MPVGRPRSGRFSLKRGFLPLPWLARTVLNKFHASHGELGSATQYTTALELISGEWKVELSTVVRGVGALLRRQILQKRARSNPLPLPPSPPPSAAVLENRSGDSLKARVRLCPCVSLPIAIHVICHRFLFLRPEFDPCFRTKLFK